MSIFESFFGDIFGHHNFFDGLVHEFIFTENQFRFESDLVNELQQRSVNLSQSEIEFFQTEKL